MQQRKQAIAWLEKYNYQGITIEKALSYIDQDNLNNEKVASVVSTIKQMDNLLGGDVLLQQLQATSVRRDLAKPLLASKADIHFICSEQDSLVNFDWLNKLIHQSKSITAMKVKGKGHMLPLEQPQLIADTLNQFFAEH